MEINHIDLEITSLSHGTCVQIKHIPTNITVLCYDYLDERKNRAQAFQKLKAEIKLRQENHRVKVF